MFYTASGKETICVSLRRIIGHNFLRAIWHIRAHFLSDRSQAHRAPLRPFDQLFCPAPTGYSREYATYQFKTRFKRCGCKMDKQVLN